MQHGLSLNFDLFPTISSQPRGICCVVLSSMGLSGDHQYHGAIHAANSLCSMTTSCRSATRNYLWYAVLQSINLAVCYILLATMPRCHLPSSVLEESTTSALYCSQPVAQCLAICANTDISGIGVRVAFYAQSVISGIYALFFLFPRINDLSTSPSCSGLPEGLNSQCMGGNVTNNSPRDRWNCAEGL